MNVSAVLKAKGGAVETAVNTTTVQQVAEILFKRRIGAVVILDDNGKLEGIFSERDLVGLIAQGGAGSLDRPVRDVMTTDVVTCQLDNSMDELMSMMTKGRFRHLPVMDADRLAGIISIGDVVKHHIAEVELEVSAMRGYLATG